MIPMIQALPAIKSLATEFVTIPAHMFSALVAELQEVKAELRAIRAEQAAVTETLHLNIAQDRKRIAVLEESPVVNTKQATAPVPGSKTEARIEKIDQTLKSRGATTLKELCRILKILPQELSRILRRIDKRRYDLTARPGDRRQKVLKLRAWTDPKR